MGELAARTIFSNDTGPLAGTGLDTLAKNQGAILELEGAQAPQSKTITDGSISPTAAYVIVDTEGSAAADDLDVINPVLSASENLHDGMVLYLKAADSGRVVTVKNSGSANGINTYDGNDYVLSTTHWLKLQLRSGKWYEVEGRAMETALAAAGAAAAASLPATTTARGIGRVATSADLVDGATITNSPAFLAAGVHTSVAAAAGKVPVADADGSLNNWTGARYATCATAASVAAKIATLSNFQLAKGARIFVTFSNKNTASSQITLNVNGTGDKAVANDFGVTSSSNFCAIPANVPVEFFYNGTQWEYSTGVLSTIRQYLTEKLLSTWSSGTGTWTVTGVIPDIPLRIAMTTTGGSDADAVEVVTTSGADDMKVNTNNWPWAMGRVVAWKSGNSLFVKPTSNTVIFSVNRTNAMAVLKAYQAGQGV